MNENNFKISNLEAKAKCPYCREVLGQKQVPKIKKKCPHCGNTIYACKLISTGENALVIEEEANKINADWKKIRFNEKWMSNLKRFNISVNDFNAHKDNLHKKFGTMPNDHDVFWAIFNDLVRKNQNDLQKLQQIYFDMGRFLYEEGNDGFDCFQQAVRMRLLYYKNDNLIDFITKVEISAIIDDRTCEHCRKLDGKRFTIDEALEEMPIPCKGAIDANGVQSSCRCVYVPITKYDE